MVVNVHLVKMLILTVFYVHQMGVNVKNAKIDIMLIEQHVLRVVHYAFNV